MLACRAACDFYSKDSVDYLNDPSLAKKQMCAVQILVRIHFAMTEEIFYVKGHLLS